MKKRKFGFAALSLAILAFGLAGCGNGGTEASNKKNDNTITIMAPYSQAEPPAADSDIQTQLEKNTETEIDITWVPTVSYDDKLNVTLASGNLPEIMIFGTNKPASFVKSAKAGAFWELSDYLKDYPNLAQADETVLKNSSVNGEVYGIYRRRDIIRNSVTLRKDWLENLNLKEPESVDDLYNIAKAFTENDPDGNGKDDTSGFIMGRWDTIGIVASWMGAPNLWGEDEKGNLYPAFSTPEYFDALNFIKKMVDNGYVNTDFATTQDDPIDLFVQGKGGSYALNAFQVGQAVQKLGAEKALEEVAFTGSLKGPDGKVRAMATDGYSGMLAIPKSSVKTEEQLKTVLQFIDKLCEKENQVLMNNGFEGKNFEVDPENDKFGFLLDPESSENKKITNDYVSFSQLSPNVQGDEYYKLFANKDVKKLKEQEYAISDNDKQYAIYNAAAPYVSDTYAAKGATLDNIISDAGTKFIAGQIDEKGWNEAVELWYKSGGQDVVDELSKLNKADK